MMPLHEAASWLDIKPHKGAVHNRIRREAASRSIPLAHILKDNCLTAEAESVVRLVVEENERQETKRGSVEGKNNELELRAAYSKLEVEFRITREELERVTAYLDNVHRLLGQLVQAGADADRTIEVLECRLCALESQKQQNLKERFVEATKALVVRPMTEIYYANTLKG